MRAGKRQRVVARERVTMDTGIEMGTTTRGVETAEETAGELGTDVTGVLNADVVGVSRADVLGGAVLDAVSDDPSVSSGAEDRATRTLTGVQAAETREESNSDDTGDVVESMAPATPRDETSCSWGRGSGGSRSTRHRRFCMTVLICAEGVSATALSR
jgi:hypothetical protein